MKDELSLAGETEDVQAVKAKIMKLFKDIVSTCLTIHFKLYFCEYNPRIVYFCNYLTRGNGKQCDINDVKHTFVLLTSDENFLFSSDW